MLWLNTIAWGTNVHWLTGWVDHAGFLPLGLLALLGLAACTSFDVINHLGLVFVLLSLVTLPHVVVMDGPYRK